MSAIQTRIISAWRAKMAPVLGEDYFDRYLERNRTTIESMISDWWAELQTQLSVRASALEEQARSKAAGRSDFQQRKEARIVHLRERAAAKAQESREAYERSHKRLEHIPLGQPILVGHYSEKRHRRDIDRANADMRRSIEASNESVRAERRAEAAEDGRAISSDDPDAIIKLEARIAEREALRQRLHARKKAGETVEAWRFSNLSADIRRIKMRVEELKKRAVESVPSDYVVGEYRATWDSDDNRVAVYMPFVAKGDARTKRAEVMRRAGFVWSPSSERYQRKASNGAWYQAKSAIDTLAPESWPTQPERVSSISPINAPVTPGAIGLSTAELEFLEELRDLDKTPNSGVARWHSIDPDTTMLNPPATVRHLEGLGYILYRKEPESVALTVQGSLLAFNVKHARGSEVGTFEVIRIIDYWVVGVLNHAFLIKDVVTDRVFVVEQTASIYAPDHAIGSLYTRYGQWRSVRGRVPLEPGSIVELELGPLSKNGGDLSKQAAALFASEVEAAP